MSTPERPEGTGLYSRCRHCHGDVFNYIRAYGRCSVRLRHENGHTGVSVCSPDVQWDEPPVYICRCGAQAMRPEELVEVYAVRAYNPGMDTEYIVQDGRWVKADKRKYPRKARAS